MVLLSSCSATLPPACIGFLLFLKSNPSSSPSGTKFFVIVWSPISPHPNPINSTLVPGTIRHHFLLPKMTFNVPYQWQGTSQVALGVKNPPANAGDTGDLILILGLERSSGGGYGNPLQYSCLENPMNRGVWWATVQRATKSQKQLNTHAHTFRELPFL